MSDTAKIEIKSHHLRALARDIEDCDQPQSWADYCRAAAAMLETQAARIAELEAALATARRGGMEEAAKIAADFETVAYQHGNLPINDPNECAAQAAREIATSIRAAHILVAVQECNRPSEEIIREDRDSWPDHQANNPIRAALEGGKDE